MAGKIWLMIVSIAIKTWNTLEQVTIYLLHELSQKLHYLNNQTHESLFPICSIPPLK